MSSPPAKRSARKAATQVLARLTALSQELAGAVHPAGVIKVAARALTDILAPDRLTLVVLDEEPRRPLIGHDTRGPARGEDPLLQLALRRGPLVFPRHVSKAARWFGVDLGAKTPPLGSWIGAPMVARGRTIGAVSLGAARAGAYGPPDLTLVQAIVAQAVIALENARLVELRTSGKREWEQTVDAITQGICILDAHGTVRRGNRVFADLLQMPVTALPGRPWSELLPPAWADLVARAMAEPEAGPIELRAGDRLLLVSAIPTADTGATVLVFEDHTDKRRLQEQLIQSEKMSAIGQLIAGVAHDLNNPLASVVGFSDFLAEAEEIPPALAEPLQVIRQEAERAATIVKNLLSFARRQEGEHQLQPIKPILESTLALLRAELMAHNVVATLEVEDGLPEVEVNANQIKQVFVNLITNAAQAIGSTDEPGRIWVTAKRWLDGVAVSVTDNGPGIPEEIGARVFEPFFTTKAEGEGTGLGLSICQGILKEHGGQITLDSGAGAWGGATFTVEIPGAARAARPAPAPLAVSQGKPLRILVVDDEPHILHYMRVTLESWGHTVALASDGTEGLQRALAGSFEIGRASCRERV